MSLRASNSSPTTAFSKPSTPSSSAVRVSLPPSGSVSIAASSLIVSNHTLQTSSYITVSNTIVQSAGGPINLSPSYLLDDGTLAAGCATANTNKNFWNCSGLNLNKAPVFG